jgi:hypothetical protein
MFSNCPVHPPAGPVRHLICTLAMLVLFPALIGWCKTTGNFRKSRYRGVARTNAQGQYVAIACNLVRMAKLTLGPPGMARA